MRRLRIFASLAVLLLCLAIGPRFISPAQAEIRQPVVAGAFYPAAKDELAFQIDKFLDKVPAKESKADSLALIVPHAGYDYSGQVAAYAYSEVEGKSFDTVILIGASHHLNFDGLAVPDYEYFATPLGRVPVDQNFIRQLKDLSGKIIIDNTPHLNEHALEVQLPFLQKTLQPGFKIVPVLFGNISLANCQALAYALNFLITDRTLVIISSDWSHYYPAEVAKKLDDRGIALVLKSDLENYVKALAAGETEACGAPAIITALMLMPALGANRVELLKYANTGDVTGDKSKVVGYAAIIFSRQASVLTESEKKKLLRIARRALVCRLKEKKPPIFEPPEANLNEKRGAFVTLTRRGSLRGCLGYIQPIKPLYQVVQEMAVQAAANDRRFEPVAESELKEIKIEISVLSRLEKINNISEIEIGRHGLYIINGERSGLLLPQVPVEWGWDRHEFLKQVCLKAGLPEDAWRDKNSILYRFTAEVFSEQ